VKNPNKQVNNIFGYCRASTRKQCEDGITLETQQKLISEFVKNKFGREVDRFFIDAGVTGKADITARPASRELTDTMDLHDVVVATRLDRLSRNFTDLLNTIPAWEETGVSLYLSEQFGDIPIVYPKQQQERGLRSRFDMAEMTNKIMLVVLSAVADVEHASTIGKLADGKVDWASRGYFIGGVAPFGYRTQKERVGKTTRQKLVEIPDEQAVLKTIYACRKRGLGVKRIAKQVQNMHKDFSYFPWWKVRAILERKEQGLAHTT